MAFKVFLIYHTHIDIGYTARQERIEQYQGDFINSAVNCAIDKKQASREEKCKFRFTAEGFWAVDKFLEKYKEEGEARLVKAIESGYFELSANYAHQAEMLDFNTYDFMIKKCYNFAKKHNLKLPEMCMSADVNGLACGLAQSLYNNGVRYYSTCINTHHGGAPFGRPLVPFYWQTPNGDKLLVWNGLTYLRGNLMGIVPGWNQPGNLGAPGFNTGWKSPRYITSVDQTAKGSFFKMVKGLKATNYPYDFIPLMTTGAMLDNGPVGDQHCEMVAEWNEKYGNEIEIVTSTLTDFFKHLESSVKDIPTYSGEWTDWWTDGIASTPQETNLFRKAFRIQRKILSMPAYSKLVSDEEIMQLNELLCLYSEHTWGHSQSYNDPLKTVVRQTDIRKSSYALNAYNLAKKLLDRLNIKAEKLKIDFNNDGKCLSQDMKFKNDFYSIKFDNTGVLEYKKADGTSLLSSDLKLGQPIYQIFPKCQRSAMAGFDHGKRSDTKNDIISYGEAISTEVLENNSSECKVAIDYKINGALSCKTIFTMQIDKPFLDIRNELVKTMEFDPEGMYLALPLNIDGGEWYLDKPLVLSKVGDQLPQTCCDYYSCIRGVALSNNKDAMVVNIFGSPLVTFGKIKLWDFSTKINPVGNLFNWITNNKWETNFRCECSGVIVNEYRLQACPSADILNVLQTNDLNL